MQTLQADQSQLAASSLTNTKSARTKSDRKALMAPQLTVELEDMLVSPAVATEVAAAEVFSLPPEQVLKLQALSIAVGKMHEATRNLATELVVCAIKCGLLLIAAKDTVGRGNFEHWFKIQQFTFSRATRCKYMRLAERMCEEVKCKPGLLLSVVPATDDKPIAFTFQQAGLQTIITEVCLKRTITELYADWDIKKAASKTVDDTKDVVGERPTRQDLPGRAFGTMIRFMETLPTTFKQLEPQNRAELVTKLEALLVSLRSVPPADSI